MSSGSQGCGSLAGSMQEVVQIPGCACNNVSKHCIDSVPCTGRFKCVISFNAQNNSYEVNVNIISIS